MKNDRPGSMHDADLLEQCIRALHEKDSLSFAGRFVQGFVHNANGPLQNLSMLTELLLSGLDMQDRIFREHAGEEPRWSELLEKQRKKLLQVREQVYAMATDLREFVQLHETQRNGTDVNINSLVTNIVKVFRADLFFKHKIKPELRLTTNLPPMRIPGRDIIPALFHLIQNAITAVQDAPRKEITIETGLDEGHLLVRITDSGCGLCGCGEPDSLFNLFESHWENGGTQKTHLGFGLYAARRLLSPHGATVTLGCGAEGTSATVRVPLV